MSRQNTLELDVNDAALAVIQFVLENPSRNPMEILRLWNEGDFDALREGWPDVPENIFDQL